MLGAGATTAQEHSQPGGAYIALRAPATVTHLAEGERSELKIEKFNLADTCIPGAFASGQAERVADQADVFRPAR